VGRSRGGGGGRVARGRTGRGRRLLVRHATAPYPSRYGAPRERAERERAGRRACVSRSGGPGDPGAAGAAGATHTVSSPARLAVLASGGGTVLQSSLDAGLPVAVVLTDRPCAAVERAERAGVPAVVVPRTFGL